MTDSAPVSLSRGLPETILPAVPDEWRQALSEARVQPAGARRAAIAEVAAAYPKYLDAWADLSELAEDRTEAYAYARVGYHRGLDTLRAAGWHGTGYVRAVHETNLGFLRSLEALWRAARDIGEHEEQERCATFLRQLDPSWTG